MNRCQCDVVIQAAGSSVLSAVKAYTVRFRPGEELKSGLLRFVRNHALRAPFIMTCVGSVTKATIRMPTVSTCLHTDDILFTNS